MQRALVALCFVGIASASIRPEFWPERSAWDATDILILGPLPEPGNFEVIETIKGSLKTGSLVSLPQLRGDDNAPVSLREAVMGNTYGSGAAGAYLMPRLRTTQRLLVFLVRAEEGWRPAAPEWNVTAAWIEDTMAYGFSRGMKIGDTYLMPVGTERGLRLEIRLALARRDRFDRALANPDDDARAREFGAIVREKGTTSSYEAFEQLSHGGRPAARVLFDLMVRPPVDWVGRHALELFRLSGNATAVVQEKLQKAPKASDHLDQLTALQLIHRLELWNAVPDAKRFCEGSAKAPDAARECEALSRLP